MYTSTQIEDAILATLKDDPGLAAYVKLFTPLVSIDFEDWRNTIHNFPAIGVASSTGDYTYKMSNISIETGIFHVFCINRNLRSPSAALRGGVGDKGCWDMIEDCRRRIVANPTLGLAGVDCLPVRRELVGTIDDKSAKGLRLAVAGLYLKANYRNA